jgi:hypothetical protein
VEFGALNLPRFGSFLLAALWCSFSLALEVVAEAEAPIVNDDLTLARQTALRRVMANAIEQEGSSLRSETISTPGGAETRTTLTPQMRALGAKILSENVVRGRLRLTAEVTLAEPGRAADCQNRPLRKVVVTAFPLRYPEQIKYGEYMGWPQISAEELTRVINGRGKLLSASMPRQFPFTSTETAPQVNRKDGVPILVDWAKRERAQYVIAGIFRDFGVSSQSLIIPERQMVIEAYIFDGISGDLIARHEFSRLLNFSWQMPKNLNPGTKSFMESRLGEAFYELLGDISQWAEGGLGCLPFSTRVVRVDGRQIYLDAGSDSGIEPGTEFVLTHGGASISTPAGDLLAGERTAVAGAVIRQVHPRYSVAEITAKKNAPTVRVGDVLYGF